ncbi:unnamed protein product [Angiostrongylus costaricensis]|uniref:Cytochrome b-c1 complex subunit 1, mitochondrial n=1 Tax=Angiostrongylus costaricensis TaxID=334426 RepID=A0A158PDA7_ANGCS|nr:unnamed protein product [Angiostrongylus costaricensis]
MRNVASLSVKEVLANQPTVEVSTLKNGFRVVAEENGRPTATVGVWIETGSRYETETNNGVAHFLERLMHKGTEKRTSSALESELEKIGARLKSYTSRDRTAVYIQSSSQDVDKVVDILADVLRNSKLDSSAIEAERKVLLSELDEYEDNLQKMTMDNLHKAAVGFQYFPNLIHLSFEITAQHLKEWQEDNYRPVRMVLSAVGGGCSGSKMQGLAEKYFDDLSNEYPRKVPEAKGIRFTGSEYRYRNDYIPHMYAAVAVEGVGYGHKDALALQMANQFIGQWDVTHATTLTAPSRWIQKISHNYGLHYLEHFNLHYKDTGLFGVYFVSDGDHLDNSHTIMRAIQHEWKHLAGAVSEEETTLARNQLRTALYGSLETNSEKAEHNALELLYTGNVRSLADIEEEISRIDRNRLKEVVFNQVYDRDTANVGVGLTEAYMSYPQTRAAMSWWRL